MWVLVLGLLLFFVPHSVKMALPGLRSSIIAARGDGPWRGMVALPSLAGIGLMIWGWMLYRDSAPDIYTPPEWGNQAASVLMFLGLVFLFSSGGPVGRIKAFVRHPMAAGILAWGLAHLVSNGDLASLLLFGVWSVYALVSSVAQTLRGAVVPKFESLGSDVKAVVIAAAVYALFVFFLHGFLFSTPLNLF